MAKVQRGADYAGYHVMHAGEQALADTVDELRLTGLDRALILSRLALERHTKTDVTDATHSLARHFASAEARTRDVWRATSEKVELTSTDADIDRR